MTTHCLPGLRQAVNRKVLPHFGRVHYTGSVELVRFDQEEGGLVLDPTELYTLHYCCADDGGDDRTRPEFTSPPPTQSSFPQINCGIRPVAQLSPPVPGSLLPPHSQPLPHKSCVRRQTTWYSLRSPHETQPLPWLALVSCVCVADSKYWADDCVAWLFSGCCPLCPVRHQSLLYSHHFP